MISETKNKPLIRDPQYISDGDYVVMESTYGNRYHKKGEDHVVGLARIIQADLRPGQGNVVIPAFAVGRTQELLYMTAILRKKSWLPVTMASRYMWIARWQ